MKNKKLKVLMEVLNNVSLWYAETTQYTDKNMKEVCEGGRLMVEVVFYFVVFGLMVAL